jgi:hypothetical protein
MRWGSDLGDLLGCLSALGAMHDERARNAIATTLGIDLQTTAFVGPKKDNGERKIVDDSRPPVDNASKHITQPHLNEFNVQVKYIDEDPVDEGPPQWFHRASPLPRPTGTFRPMAPKQTLLEPSWARGLLIALISTLVETGEVDESRLVEKISLGMPILDLPLKSCPTLARGVCCWVDQGAAMQPFTLDQKQLLSDLRRVAGASRVDVRSFQGFPRREGVFVHGTPHVVLSDLSHIPLPEDCGRNLTSPVDWLEFVAWVRAELQARVIILTPCPPQEYDADLRQAATILLWDRSTNVRTALRSLQGVP